MAPDWLSSGATDMLHDVVSERTRMLKHMAAFVRVMDIRSAYFAGASMGATRLFEEAAAPSSELPIATIVVVSVAASCPKTSIARSCSPATARPRA